MGQEEKSNFNAIFDFIKNIGVKEEFREKNESEIKQPVLKYQEIPQAQSPTSNFIPEDKDVFEMNNKLIEYIRKINEDGIDFFEVWESSQAMGGTEENLKQAFMILKIASGNTLTVEKVIDSANRYKSKLNSLVENNVLEKKSMCDSLISNQNNEKISLQKDIERITNELERLNAELASKKNTLQNIDLDYSPKINSIKKQILVAESGLKNIIEKIDKTIFEINKIKN